MHSWYSRHHNRPMLSQYTIFVAEVASTVNEILLNRYLLDHSDSEEEKAYLLSNLLNQLVGTLYRQPMYAEFEKQLYAMLENKEAVSSQKPTPVHGAVQAVLRDAVEVDDLQRYHCYHTYRTFISISMYINIPWYVGGIELCEEDTCRRYNGVSEFLTKGGSESPLDERSMPVLTREWTVSTTMPSPFRKTLG